ncbi:family 20 glycosylhydrolase [Clostridium tarantellae]|uniref:beta-N-acetylhexosaminidase n=1 Tax=Clostridium tarantellae TaxID=39493 RepID=A0A6I1MRG1_9CLOT|nr:family 20 glycosylhydrolase [Clostridium tarantellae]MPQ43481.1 family 20 glycosylhydrolase [Clostridium tarantellae]
MNYNIIPQLKNVEIHSKLIKLNDFYIDDSISSISKVPKEFLLEGSFNELDGKYAIKFIKNKMNIKDAYKIEIKEKEINIYAEDLGGLIYASSTVSQLDILNNGTLKECIIEDSADMSFRAMSDDISRGQVPTYENFQQVIKNLARYKYNVYMPYIEDVFKFKCCPDWGKFSDGLSGEEWKSLSEYAKQYNIQIRPIINLLGHFDKNTSLKELQKLTIQKEDGSHTDVIDPFNPKVKPLLSKIFDEVVEAFGAGVIHVGGDEPSELTEVYGKEKGGKAFIDHYTWIHNELEKRDCDMMMYADFFAPPWGDYSVGLEKALELPKGINFVFWDYNPKDYYPYVEKLREIGLTVTVSPGSWTWNRFASNIKASWGNTKGLLKTANGQCDHMIMSSWGDGGDCPRELMWPGVIIGAHFAWNNNSSYEFEDFYYAYHKLFFGLDEEDAKNLLNVYHYDNVMNLDDNFIFKLEIFKTPLEISDFEFKKNAHLLIDEMNKALSNIEKMKIKRNINIFDALYLSAMKIKFTAEKLTYLPWEKLTSREDAMTYINKVLYLASEIEKLRLYHEKVWFASNRKADWGYVDTLYHDLRDEFYSLARRFKNFKKFYA